jgi:large subunit ribosomal protein L10
MALNLEDKKALVAEVSAVAATALSVVAAEYRGLTVSQMTDLRSKARRRACTCVWSRTRWRARPWPGTSFECMGRC